MRRVFLVVIALALAIPAPGCAPRRTQQAAADGEGGLHIDPPAYSFGRIAPTEKERATFRVRNDGSRTIRVLNIVAD